MNLLPMRTSLIVALACVATASTDAQKPVITLPVFTDYMPVPNSLTDWVRSADALVLITVQAVDSVTVTPNARTSAKTTYTLRLEDVIKGTLSPESSIKVQRPGGDIDVGDKIYRSVD